MALPGNLTVVTVTGTYLTPVGVPCTGTVTFSLDYPLADATGTTILYSGDTTVVLDATGRVLIQLAATDQTQLSPEPFTYRVTEAIAGRPLRVYNISLPSASAPTVDLSALAPVPPVVPVGVTISGTPSAGQVVTALSSTTADWQTPAATTTLSAADASVVVGGTSSAPTVRTAALDVLATLHPAADSVPMNSQKFTGLTNGAQPQDSATFGQIPTAGTVGSITVVGNTLAAGASGQYADAAHSHASPMWVPADNNLIWATVNPLQAGNTDTLLVANAGVVTLQRVLLRTAATLTNILFGVSGVDNTSPAFSNCYLGLYDSNGTRRAVTADLSSVINVALLHTVAFTAPYAAPAGEYFIGLVLNGTWTGGTASTTWNLKATGGGVTANSGLAAPHLYMSNMLTGQTTLPSSITLANQSTSLITGGWGSQWYGLS
jgi:hypothetical protein